MHERPILKIFIVWTGLFWVAPVFAVDNMISADENIGTLIITESTSYENPLLNYGTISRIEVNPAYTLAIANYGTITDVCLQAGSGEQTSAQLVQVINGTDAVNGFNVIKTNTSNFVVVVDGVSGVSLQSILDIAPDMNSLDIKNSTIILDASSDNVDINLSGIVQFTVAFPDGVDELTLQNIGEMSSVPPQFNILDSSDSVYTVSAGIEGGVVYARRVRNVNYADIIEDDNTLNIINQVQDAVSNNESHNNEKLLENLNVATSVQEIQNILSQSVLFNPSLLMRPVRNFNLFNALSVDSCDSGNNVFADLSYLFSDDFSIPTARMGITLQPLDVFKVVASGHIGLLDYSGDLNEYTGTLYGGAVSAVYNDTRFIGGLTFGVTQADFDLDSVLYNGTIKNNPSGISKYLVTKMGVRFSTDFGITITPGAGVLWQSESIYDESMSDTNAMFSADIDYAMLNDAVQYRYGLQTNVLTDGTVYVDARGGISLPDDNVGVFLGAGLLYDANRQLDYKLSLHADWKF